MYSRQSRSPCVTKSGTFYYPYYLAYATGVLERAGFEVKLLDAVAEGMTHQDAINFAAEFKPDVLVTDTSTPSIYNDAKISDEIKTLTGCFVVLVGTHPTALPEETFGLGNIDAVCRGEYDYTLLDLVRKLESGGKPDLVDGISYRKDGKIHHNKNRDLIENLDDLPFVSVVYKKHLNIRKYFYASLMHPQITILTARGCPYNCSFCNAPFKNSYRTRSVENVANEFEWINKNLPEVREIMIEDETFPVNKKRVLDLCRELKKRGIGIKWSCNARVNTDFETLDAMGGAGCRLMCVGFESPDQTSLDVINKKTTKDMQLEFMKNSKRAGLLVNGCFILGLPGDTKETIKRTVNFAKELRPDTAQFYPLMAYPGTSAYKWAKDNGLLITEDFSKLVTKNGMHNTVISRPGLTDMELVELCDEARRQFYARPSYVLSKLGQILRHPKETKRVLKAGKRFLPTILREKNV